MARWSTGVTTGLIVMVVDEIRSLAVYCVVASAYRIPLLGVVALRESGKFAFACPALSAAASLLPAASAQNIMNADTTVADALSGPLGWALLAGAAAVLIAWGLFQEINQPAGTQSEVGGQNAEEQAQARAGSHRGQFGLDTTVTGPTMFLAGEAGRERVTITPEGKTGTIGRPIAPTINIYGATDPI